MATLAEVCGIMANTTPLSYVERADVDDDLRYALNSYGIVVVYGRSKQGKSTLRCKYVKPRINAGIAGGIDSVEIRCTENMTVADIYKRLLNIAGYAVQEAQREEMRSNEQSSGSGVGANFAGFSFDNRTIK